MTPDEELSEEEKALLRGVEQDPEPWSFPQWFTALFAVFITVFFIISIIASYPLFSIILGWFDSGMAGNNVVEANGVTVQFRNGSMDIILSYWDAHPDVEVALCLSGQVTNQTYTVEEVYRPAVYSESFTHVRHAPCGVNTTILFHTHPPSRCLASQTDLNGLQERKQRDPDTILMIMCTPQRFSVYT